MALALRFISGKYQGGEFPLEEGREVVIGRSSDLDMVLVEEMVSRKHAKLVLNGEQVRIEDLGSTNGTFVNGERVTQTSVGEGDRILIGSNILRVVQVGSGARPQPPPGSPPEAAPVPPIRRGVRRPDGEGSTEVRMSGDLEEIPLPDLLQLFATSKKNGVLLIDTGLSLGTIVLRKGEIYHATLEGRDKGAEMISGHKAVYRMLAWESGVFELDPPNDEDVPQPMNANVQEVLMEAFRQKDELGQLQDRLPPWQSQVGLPRPLAEDLKQLSPVELDVLRLAHNCGSVGATMDMSPLSDLETAEALMKLVDKGYLSIMNNN